MVIHTPIAWGMSWESIDTHRATVRGLYQWFWAGSGCILSMLTVKSKEGQTKSRENEHIKKWQESGEILPVLV